MMVRFIYLALCWVGFFFSKLFFKWFWWFIQAIFNKEWLAQQLKKNKTSISEAKEKASHFSYHQDMYSAKKGLLIALFNYVFSGLFGLTMLVVSHTPSVSLPDNAFLGILISIVVLAMALSLFIDKRYTDFVRYNWLREFEEYNNLQKFRVVAIGLFLFFFSFIFLVGSFLLMSYL